MKAITVTKPGTMELLEAEKPEITSPDQVLVKIHATGICGSDLHVYHGSNPYALYPRVIGHEAAGEIVAIGSGVTDLVPGDGVVLEPVTYCGQCYACKTGHHNVCRNLRVLGCIADGTFREYMVVPRSQVYPFDRKKLTYIEASLCEPYTIGAQATWRGQVKPGDMVLVHGAGPIGLIVADMAKDKGATVIVSEPDEARLAMAKDFGADHSINPAKDNLDDFLHELTDGEGVNVIFEAAGVPALTAHGVRLLSPAGRLVPLSFGKEPVPINFKEVNAKELTILGTRHQFQKFPQVIQLLPERLDRIHRLITHSFPFSQYEKAFALLENHNSGAGKVILTLDE